MADEKFSDFTEKVSINQNDYLVGYINDGTDNFRILKSNLSFLASQISDFNNAARNVLLTGFQPNPPEAIIETDSIFTALQKLQALQNVNQATFSSIGNRNANNGYVGIDGGKILSSLVPRAAGDYTKSQITGLANTDNVIFNQLIASAGANRFGPAPAATGNTISYQNTARLSAYATRNNATLNDAETVLLLGKEGTPGSVFANFVRHDLSRYESSSDASRTRYDIRLAHESLINEGNNTPTILSMYSNGLVYMPGRIQARIKGSDSGTAVFMDSSAAALYAANSTMTSDTVLAAPETILTLGRKGRNNIAYDSYARFDLSRYETNPAPDFGSRTRLDIRCTHGAFTSTGESNNTPIAMSFFSGGWVTHKLPTSTLTDALLDDGYCYLFSNAGIPTLRSRSGSTYTNTALGGGGGGSIPYLQQNLLALGSTLSASDKTFFTNAQISSVIAHYEPAAPVNGKKYSWAHFKNGQYGLRMHTDDVVQNQLILFAAIPDSTDITKSTVVFGGYKAWTPHIINFGGSSPFILDSLLANGAHSIIGWAAGASGAKAYDWHLSSDGELALKRINDAGNAFTDTAIRISPLSATTSRMDVSGSINTPGPITGQNLSLFGGGTNAYVAIKNTDALTGLQQWITRANTDGSLKIIATNDVGANPVDAITINRTASGGNPAISTIYRAGNSPSFDTTSDSRTKENVKALNTSDALASLMKVEVKSFTRTANYLTASNDENKIYQGYIAQQIESIEEFKDCVTKSKAYGFDDFRMLNPAKIEGPYTTASIQQLYKNQKVMLDAINALVARSNSIKNRQLLGMLNTPDLQPVTLN